MAASVAKSGFGTLIEKSDGGSPAVYTPIAEVYNIKAPSLSRDTIDVTHHESTAGWREFIGGLPNAGEVTLDVNFLPANATQTAQTTNLSSSSPFNTYRIVFSDLADTRTVTADAATDRFTTATNHSWNTAQPVQFSTTGTLPTTTPQIVAGRFYFAARYDADELKLYPTSADAIADTNQITIEGAGSGTHTIKSGTTWTFSAMCAGFEPEAPIDDKLKVTIKLKVSGTNTITP